MAPTRDELKSGLMMLQAVADTVRELGECPSETIYAALIGKVSFEGCQKILTILSNAGLIKVAPSHMITWVGPMLPQSCTVGQGEIGEGGKA